MQQYYVPQPKRTPSPQRQGELIQFLIENQQRIDDLWKKTSQPYMPWKKFEAAYRAGYFGAYWSEQQISVEDAWYLLQVRRRFTQTQSPVRDTRNEPFSWSKLPTHERLLHDFSMQLGGSMATSTLADGAAKNQVFLRQSLIEEAIASSQLEGAATTRERAKKMFAEKRKPSSNGEWMIYNNYLTIKQIEEETSNYPLSRDVLLALHVTMTTNTDIEPDQIGRWRTDDDDIVVKRLIHSEEMIAHVPPKEAMMQVELDRLLAFANDQDADEDFLNPITKAIIIHFWFAYLHPFCDGNGRLSRSLFYWYLMRHKYWLIGLVPISTVIKKSPAQYADAYCFSEQYSNDLTYFIDYNLRKIEQALVLFTQYMERKKDKINLIDRLLPEAGLNHRQKQALHHLLGKSDDTITVTQHANFHEVSWITASQDIKALQAIGYLEATKRGQSVLYTASDRLKALLEDQ